MCVIQDLDYDKCVVNILFMYLVVTSANALDVQTSHTTVSGKGLGSLTLYYLN